MATATKWANHKITTLQRQSNQRLMKCACKTPCFYCNRPWNLIRTTWCWSLCLFDFAFGVFWLYYVFISYNKHFVKWSWFELREYRWIGDVIIAVVIAIYAIANFCSDIFRYWFFHSFLHGFVLYGPQLTSCHFEAISEKLKKVIRKAALLYPKIKTLQSWHFFPELTGSTMCPRRNCFFSVAIIVIIRKAAFTYRNFVEVCLL